MRLGDVIEKTQSELNTSKIQLSQIQRQEAQSRQELDSIRSLTNNKDKRGKELQVYKCSNQVRYPLRNNYVIEYHSPRYTFTLWYIAETAISWLFARADD